MPICENLLTEYFSVNIEEFLRTGFLIGTSSAPIGASSAPVGASSAPIGTSSAPIRTSSAPVGASSAPIGTSSVPIGASSAPIETSSTPIGTLLSYLLNPKQKVFSINRSVTKTFKCSIDFAFNMSIWSSERTAKPGTIFLA